MQNYRRFSTDRFRKSCTHVSITKRIPRLLMEFACCCGFVVRERMPLPNRQNFVSCPCDWFKHFYNSFGAGTVCRHPADVTTNKEFFCQSGRQFKFKKFPSMFSSFAPKLLPGDQNELMRDSKSSVSRSTTSYPPTTYPQNQSTTNAFAQLIPSESTFIHSLFERQQPT